MDAINNLMNTGKEIIGVGQIIAPLGCTYCIVRAGFKYFTGGKDGSEKAKPYLKGAFVGLVLTLMANSLTSFISSKITF